MSKEFWEKWGGHDLDTFEQTQNGCTIEDLYQAIEQRIMESDKVYEHFAERFRQENYIADSKVYREPTGVILEV